MRADSRCGFNVIGLAAVTVAVMLLALALIPAVSNAVIAGNTSAVSSRGKDIYVSIVGANTEREPLGLSPVWPSENPPVTNNGPHEVECFNFSNSTDYFKRIYDEENAGTADWSPLAAGFDYTRLAGAGVPPCTSGKLRPENNMWTIAMNVADDWDDTVPVLITRNIDASSLAAKVTDKDWDKALRFDPEWETPFGNTAFVLIRKGGAIFKARAKYMSYSIVYCKQAFDTSVDEYGKTVAKPLTYLTPKCAVVPGERAYAKGAVRVARLSGGIWKRVKRDLKMLTSMILPVGAYVGAVYLLVTGLYGLRRYRSRLKPYLSGYGVGVGLFHFVAVVLWLCLILGSAAELDSTYPLTLLSLAILAQVMGIAFVIARRRDDHAARQRGMKWMVAAPLLVVGGLFLMMMTVPLVCGLISMIVGLIAQA